MIVKLPLQGFFKTSLEFPVDLTVFEFFLTGIFIVLISGVVLFWATTWSD
jgi:hypothetical protein